MNKIYIGNLPFKMDVNQLRSTFETYGEITDLFLVKERDGRLKGFGFITYKSEESARSALQMDGKDFGGRTLRVNIAEKREAR